MGAGDAQRSLGPGDRPMNTSRSPHSGRLAGPFSLLLILRSGASLQYVKTWTLGLLAFGDADWDCEDTDTRVNYRVPSPVRWAVERAGIVKSTRGYKSPHEVAAPSLVQFRDLLPLFMGPGPIVDILDLPDDLEHMPVEMLTSRPRSRAAALDRQR